MRAGPLDDARLRAIEECLNGGRLDEAQRRLGALIAVEGLDHGIAYLSARLLFHRGRLDAVSVAARLRDVLRARPDFAEAKHWLETVERSQAVTAPPPSRLPTPRIPEGARGQAARRTVPVSLGSLDLPRSELPTEPAPAPESSSAASVPAVHPPRAPPGPWDALELALASGKRDVVIASLDKLAARDLDTLLREKKPRFTELAAEVAGFLSRAPVTRTFAPFDLTLDSVERLDAIIGLLVPPGIEAGHYALRVSLAAYLGECVREAGNGTWEGTLADAENAVVVLDSKHYVPWNEIAQALGAGEALRPGAGAPPHPGAEPCDEAVSVVTETPTPWDPRRWPELAEIQEMTRALANSAFGIWAARCLKLPLDRTPASLRALDRYGALVNPRGKAPSADAWVRHAAVLAGGYVGELLCLHTGGRFGENAAQAEGPERFEVVLPSGTKVHPVQFAYERFSGKRTGTFSKFFEASAAGS
jgi:hypothetical protein